MSYPMKKTTLLALAFSVLFASPSYADWTKVGAGLRGNIFYVDFESIRKQDGFVQYRSLTDYSKPNLFGSFSAIVYKQGDCKLFRFKNFSYSFHTEPMGGGSSVVEASDDKDWKYPPPDSSLEYILKAVCSK